MSDPGDESHAAPLPEAQSSQFDVTASVENHTVTEREPRSADYTSYKAQDQEDEGDADEDILPIDEDLPELHFDGNASTWRFFTDSERGLVASLNQQQANDLSIHLFNSQALKTRFPDYESRARGNKKRPANTDDVDASSGWLPGPSWGAWPLRPEFVPRRLESYGALPASIEEDKATYRKSEIWRPGADLEQEVKALILRKAKEEFRRDISNGASNGEYDLIVDEDEIDTLLDPSARHILAEVDGLLLGLHNARRSLSRDRTSRQSGSDQDEPPERSRRPRSLKARDWKEVLNAALLAGWNPEVVERSANRLSSLFGEELQWVIKKQISANEGVDPARSLIKIEQSDDLAFNGYYCPVATCKRKDEPFDKSWRWREHLKRSHKYTKADIEEVEARNREPSA